MIVPGHQVKSCLATGGGDRATRAGVQQGRDARGVALIWRALPLRILILAQWPFWAMENHNAKRRTRFDLGKQALCAFNDGIEHGDSPHWLSSR